MVLYSVSKYVTHWMGPRLFRVGLTIRRQLPRATAAASSTPLSYYMDLLCGLPMAQTMLSLSLYDESSKRVQTQLLPSHSKTTTTTTTQSPSHHHHHFRPEDLNDYEEFYAKMAEIRIHVLDVLLRPILLPSTTATTTTTTTTSWKDDVHRWNWNVRILKWVRQELLVAKYGPLVKEALDAYPQIVQSPQFSRNPTERWLLKLVVGTRGGQWEWQNQQQQQQPNSTKADTKTTNPKPSTSKFHKNPLWALPSSETVRKAFRMRHWVTHKQSLVLTSTLNSTTTTTAATATTPESSPTKSKPKPSTTTNNSISMEDMLDYATGGSGGPIAQCGPLNTVCEEAQMYQLWTKEYVQYLGDYLLDRARDYHQTTPSNVTGFPPQTTILDIGAGDGLLLQFLKDYYHYQQQQQHQQQQVSHRDRRRRGPGSDSLFPTMEWIATDNGSWRIFPKARVERLEVQDALNKYVVGKGVVVAAAEAAATNNNPNTNVDNDDDDDDDRRSRQQVIVLCSWMPMGQDWTQLFRDAQVDEYILMGEADDGSCGHNWKTWGNLAEYWGDDPKPLPPFQRDGYQRWDMDEVLAPHQFSRFDSALSKSGKTVSFRRRRRRRQDR